MLIVLNWTLTLIYSNLFVLCLLKAFCIVMNVWVNSRKKFRSWIVSSWRAEDWFTRWITKARPKNYELLQQIQCLGLKMFSLSSDCVWVCMSVKAQAWYQSVNWRFDDLMSILNTLGPRSSSGRRVQTWQMNAYTVDRSRVTQSWFGELAIVNPNPNEIGLRTEKAAMIFGALQWSTVHHVHLASLCKSEKPCLRAKAPALHLSC